MKEDSADLAQESEIREFWADCLWQDLGFGSREHFLANGSCFACRKRKRLIQRAHILPACLGGADTSENLHVLCKRCHELSEYFNGPKYWRWLMADRVPWSQLPAGSLKAVSDFRKLGDRLKTPW